jgi:hypothetical protein
VRVIHADRRWNPARHHHLGWQVLEFQSVLRVCLCELPAFRRSPIAFGMPGPALDYFDLVLTSGATHPIYFLGPYYPLSDSQHASDERSKQILHLKHSDSRAVAFFAGQLECHIPSGVAITVAPGHAVGEASGGLRRLAQRLCLTGRSDATSALVRSAAVPKSSTARAGERPSAEQHRDSIVVCSSLVRGRDVWLLDDVVTRGETMRACRWLLLDPSRGGARTVTLLALGRTTRTPPQFNF